MRIRLTTKKFYKSDKFFYFFKGTETQNDFLFLYSNKGVEDFFLEDSQFNKRMKKYEK